MKFLLYLSLILLPLMNLSAASSRDPGTGSNPAVGPGPATPDSRSDSTSVMGGGTPGSQGMDTIDIDEPTQEELDTMYEQREEVRKKQKKEKTEKKEPVTDQDPELNTIRDL